MSITNLSWTPDRLHREVVRLGAARFEERTTLTSVGALSTGICELDEALCIGGLPRGRISELYGHEGSGKTTIALGTIATLQERGGVAAFIDAEHRLDVTHVESSRVNLENLLIYRPPSAEQALNTAAALLSSGGLDLLVIDSVAALLPQCQLDGDASHPGGDWASLIGRGVRKIAVLASHSNTAVLLLNQIRADTNAMFSNPITTPGGNALRHHSSVRISVRKACVEPDGYPAGTSRVKAVVTKSCVGPRGRVASCLIRYTRDH